MTISCDIPEDKPLVTKPTAIGMDRNVGNVATPDCVIMVPEKVTRRMINAERAASKMQKIAARRQKPDYTSHKLGSKRWAMAAMRAARNKRKAANIHKTIAHKISDVISNSCMHNVFEKLHIKNMAKSAKGTKESPGKNVKHKSGFSKVVLEQCWGLFAVLLPYYCRTIAVLLPYKLAGEIIWVATQYTSQRCDLCGYTHEDNRTGRKFLCKKCSHSDHADCNVGSNIEVAGLKKLGSKAAPAHRRLQPCGKLHGKLHLPHTEAVRVVPVPQQTRL